MKAQFGNHWVKLFYFILNEKSLSLILQPCDLLSLKLCEYFSYKVSLGGRPLSDQTLRTGGVYTLLIVEEGDQVVSKDSLFFYNSIVKSFDHLFSVRVTNVSCVLLRCNNLTDHRKACHLAVCIKLH